MIIAPMPSLSNPSSINPWLPRLVTLLLATLTAASVGYWVLKWPTPTSPSLTDVPAPQTAQVDTTKVAQLLGAAADTGLVVGQTPALSAASRYQLVGVIALGYHNGSALIAVDGQPAKPFRVGEHLADDLMLQAVNGRSATLAADRNSKEGIILELPLMPGAQ